MSQCKKFAPNIFNKIKCSNCFRQKEEHSAVALECNRASRSIARSGYLFLAPDWDFSVPLNRTKRWQRRWFVLYDDGELSYSVDEHPDTIPQGSVDMAQVLEVTGAEQITGHPHSLALTAPDRVTFVKAASREDARWWLELLAVFPRRRHKRNATFPGGRASPSLPHLGRSASPQPPRVSARHHQYHHLHRATGGEIAASPRTNFTTPPLKEEREVMTPLGSASVMMIGSQGVTGMGSQGVTGMGSQGVTGMGSQGVVTMTMGEFNNNSVPGSTTGSGGGGGCSLVGVVLKETSSGVQSMGDEVTSHRQERPTWVPEPSTMVPIEQSTGVSSPRTEYLISSGSPPTRDKLRCEDKARVRRDWRNERLRVIATNITDRSPESSLALPAEGLLHLKKGWLWYKDITDSDWQRLWWVLCGPTLHAYRDQEEQDAVVTVELTTVTGYSEIAVDSGRFGFQITCSGGTAPLTLSAVTHGIRSNWLQALQKAAPHMDSGGTTTTTTTGGGLGDRGDSFSSGGSRATSTSSSVITTPTTPKSVLFSSDEEYRTASEGGRRDSEDWTEFATAPMAKTILGRVKDRSRSTRNTSSSSSTTTCHSTRPPRCQSRQSTVDSVSTDELDACLSPHMEHLTTTTSNCCPHRGGNRQRVSGDHHHHHHHGKLEMAVDELKEQLAAARNEVHGLEGELRRMRTLQTETASTERVTRERVEGLEEGEREWQGKHEELVKRLSESEASLHESTDRCSSLTRELHARQRLITSLQTELSSANDRYAAGRLDNDRLYKRLQEVDCNPTSNNTTNENTIGVTTGTKSERRKRLNSIADLTDVDLDTDLAKLSRDELIAQCLDLRYRFERAVVEIRAVKKELRDAHVNYDQLDIESTRWRDTVSNVEKEAASAAALMAGRVQDLTGKLTLAERTARTLKSKLQDSREKRRSLSLKGRESFTVSKELEDKITELETKIISIEQHQQTPSSRGRRRYKSRDRDRSATISTDVISPPPTPSIDDRSLRRLRRKSLDSVATILPTNNNSSSTNTTSSSEPIKLLMRVHALETKINESLVSEEPENVASNESLSLTGEESLLVLRSENSQRNFSGLSQRFSECLMVAHQADSWESMQVALDRLWEVLVEVDTDRVRISGDCSGGGEVANSVQSVVRQLETVLRGKYMELRERRRKLREEGKWGQRQRLEVLAEKIAFENVIIGRINDALSSSLDTTVSTTNCDRLFHRETLETAGLITNLHDKLTSPNSQLTPPLAHLTSVNHLTETLTKLLLSQTNLTNTNTSKIPSSTTSLNPTTLRHLQTKRDNLHSKWSNYKATHLTTLADSLARDAERLATDDSCSLLFNRSTERAWQTARENVSAELIQSEISHVLMKTAQLYEASLSGDCSQYFFSFYAREKATLERWTDEVEDRLQRQMDGFIRELNEEFEVSLRRIRGMDGLEEEEYEKSDDLLRDYADVIAEMALIDARIEVLTTSQRVDPVAPSLDESSGSKSLRTREKSGNYDDFDISNPRLSKSSNNSELEDYSSSSRSTRLSDITGELQANFVRKSQQISENDLINLHQMEFQWELLESLQESTLCTNTVSGLDVLTAMSVAEFKCAMLAVTGELVGEEKEEIGEKGCEKCRERQRENEESAWRKPIAVTRVSQKQDSSQNTDPGDALHPGTEYCHQVEQLRAAFRRTLDNCQPSPSPKSSSTTNPPIPSSTSSSTSSGQQRRHLVVVEGVERLQVVCEQVLVAMERWHRRTLQEMRDGHHMELGLLRADKEQALAEETQATLAALDAMRKAHEAEVVKEVARFKQELSRQQASELFELRERLSVKCLESAALQEQLGSATRQLAHAHQHILHLEQRSPQIS